MSEHHPTYGPDDLADWNAETRLGQPGAYPYTRGPYASMYTGRPWTMRQYAGFGSAAETNERFKALLAAGQTGLSVAFDLPTQMGLDSDDPLALGEVGKVGHERAGARRAASSRTDWYARTAASSPVQSASAVRAWPMETSAT